MRLALPRLVDPGPIDLGEYPLEKSDIEWLTKELPAKPTIDDVNQLANKLSKAAVDDSCIFRVKVRNEKLRIVTLEPYDRRVSTSELGLRHYFQPMEITSVAAALNIWCRLIVLDELSGKYVIEAKKTFEANPFILFEVTNVKP